MRVAIGGRRITDGASPIRKSAIGNSPNLKPACLGEASQRRAHFTSVGFSPNPNRNLNPNPLIPLVERRNRLIPHRDDGKKWYETIP
ncbi:MAG: hypothetical protein V2A34_12760, partial [Lentisphaerota bacterium]